MTESNERREWSRILGDESAALQAQQATAGSSHAPVLGPPPYGDHGINMLVEAAVRAERDRCAALADTHAAAQAADPQAQALLLELGAAIRAGAAPG
ncbi:MAG TPA: hypothetical protein VFE82_08140 [Ramlibacter sp.]|uniref:hypothetical protein n=1 Tax=Ramlibacter sp. TaxID=1917967 RepID=UPI002D279322|nr:hypothetical protein [Ramlibacter sp.]HZY18437.1 hypothetical protein [Ramlibacter sp.]